MQHVPFFAVMSGWLGINPVQKIALDLRKKIKVLKYSSMIMSRTKNVNELLWGSCKRKTNPSSDGTQQTELQNLTCQDLSSVIYIMQREWSSPRRTQYIVCLEDQTDSFPNSATRSSCGPFFSRFHLASLLSKTSSHVTRVHIAFNAKFFFQSKKRNFNFILFYAEQDQI